MAQTALRSSMMASTSYSTKSPILTARPTVHNGSRRQARAMAYRGGNCGPNAYGRNPWMRGGFQMNPNDMAAAGGVIADFMDMAQKFQASNPGFPQNGPNPTMQLPLLVDLEESEEVYTLTADVPGLQKSDLKITVNKKDRTLTIGGERKRASKATAEPVDAPEQKQEQPKQQQQFRQRHERIMGKFSRTLQRLPEDADLTAVSARVEKGVLTITVKKTEQRRYEDFVEINVD